MGKADKGPDDYKHGGDEPPITYSIYSYTIGQGVLEYGRELTYFEMKLLVPYFIRHERVAR